LESLARKAIASSAGTKPAKEVDLLTIKVMEKVSISMKNQKSKVLTSETVCSLRQ